jgi:hypothetical protein
MDYLTIQYASTAFYILAAIVVVVAVAAFCDDRDTGSHHAAAIVWTLGIIFASFFVEGLPKLQIWHYIAYFVLGLAMAAIEWYQLIKKNKLEILKSRKEGYPPSPYLCDKIGSRYVPKSISSTEFAIYTVAWPARLVSRVRFDWVTYPFYRIAEYFRSFFAVAID